MIAIPKDYYTFQEAIEFLNLNHQIKTSIEELQEFAFNGKLDVGVYLYIHENKILMINHNYVDEQSKVMFSAMSEKQEDVVISDEGFYNLNLNPIHKTKHFEHLLYTSRLYPKHNKFENLHLFLGITSGREFISNHLRIAHDDLMALIGKPINTENKPLNEKSKTSYLNIIAALVETLLEDKERFPSQNKLIEHLSHSYQSYAGLSERNLKDKFAAAKNSLQNS